MRKLTVLFLCCILMLSGCKKEQADVQQTIPLPTASSADIPEDGTAPDESELFAVSVPAISETYQTESGVELFTYTAQHMQLIHPVADIADKIVLDFLNRIDSISGNAESILGAAQNDYLLSEDWHPYSYQIIFSPMRIDRDVLSLYGIQSSFSGGLHGNINCVAVNYDMTTGDYLTLGSIMHMNATKDAFVPLIIQKLNSVAEDLSLYEDFEEGVYSRFSGDESQYMDFYFTQTGLCFFFSPYEIAPYSSGVVTVEIPYSELTGLIYDGYFPDEQELLTGNMRTGSFMETDMTQFSNMAEVTLANGEDILVAYPVGNVENIRIRIAADGYTMPEYTVFAAMEMSDRDAVVISLPQDFAKNCVLSYWTNHTLEEIPLE